MPSHDKKVGRESLHDNERRISVGSLPPEFFGIRGGVPRKSPRPKVPQKRPPLVRQKAVVLIPPRKPQGVQKQRSRYDHNAVSSIRNQLRVLEMQVRFLSNLICETLPADDDPTSSIANSDPSIYGSDTVLVDGSDSEEEDDEYEDDDIEREVDALLNSTAPMGPLHNFSASDQEAFDKEIDDLLGIDREGENSGEDEEVDVCN